MKILIIHLCLYVKGVLYIIMDIGLPSLPMSISYLHTSILWLLFVLNFAIYY